MSQRKIELHEEKEFAWCELPWGNLMYGKNNDELSATLDMMSEYARKHEINV